ncbi:MAG TPA: nucleoid-associated protein [Chryseosolibacter sp.]|nr:nucleoid-associated protein [Chryseosolibacter sp.]
MVDFSQAVLRKLIIHKVGNKLLEEPVVLSNLAIDVEAQEELSTILKSYFLSHFKEPVFYHFHHVSSLEFNEIYTISGELFESTRGFVKRSKEIAQILYEYSNHPKIKAGEIYIAMIDDCNINGELTDVLGIFKSENKDTFLKTSEDEESILVNFDNGVNIKKLDKGCLVFNTSSDEGYRVMLIDTQGNTEAQYWKDEFLKLKPVSDNYYHTQQYLNLAKGFVTERLDDDFEVTKADQIDYLNRSIDYFKKNEQFNEQDFASAVFEHTEVIKSFKRFKNEFQAENDLRFVSEFDISSPAVKSQTKVFKSVLKLDRNFHVYIHGNKDLIERGVDDDGRKFYKLYYNEES